jgi:hypothetical protein
MAIYEVVRWQGVAVDKLSGNTLLTGVDDQITSCSAVMMADANCNRAGLYHFPCGNINSDHQSQCFLEKMAKYVKPRWAFIAWGGEGMSTNETDYNEKNANIMAMAAEQLRSFVLGLLPLNCRLSRKNASTGIVWLSANNGIPQVGFSTPNGTVTKLRNVSGGTYKGFRVYSSE